MPPLSTEMKKVSYKTSKESMITKTLTDSVCQLIVLK